MKTQLSFFVTRESLKTCFLFVFFALFHFSLIAQNIGINSTGAVPNASALLDIDAAPGNSKGLLIPRLTTAQMNAISSPADGLIIYNTDCKGFNYYNGNTWIAIGNTGSVTAPGAITGSATPCQNATGVAYSITAVSGATGYNWTVPTGASVATGQGTISVTVDFATTDGNVCVTASNACGTSSASCKAITLQSAPAAPTATAASNIAQTSFDANWNASAGATTYYLDVATDAGFTAFVTGYNNLNVGNVTTYGVTGLTCATAYYYRVRVGNACGTSSNSNTITVTTSACCPSFNEDFTTYASQVAADAAWPSSDVTNMRVDITNDRLNFTTPSSGCGPQTTRQISYDLVTPASGSAWILRFKVNCSTLTLPSASNYMVYIGLWSTDYTQTYVGNASDHIRFGIDVASWSPFRMFRYSGQANTSGDGGVIFGPSPATGTDYFVQIRRLSATTFDVKVYSDSGFSTLIADSGTQTITGSIGSTLRYIAVKSSMSCGGMITGILDNIQFCDGVTSF